MTCIGRAAPSAIVVIALVACPCLAEAHSPIEGLGTFYSYALHPVFVPVHSLLLIATALMLGQQCRSSARYGVLALCLAFIAGLAAATAGVLNGTREQLLLCGALVLGCAVCLDQSIPRLITTVAAAGTGFAIGIDSAIGVSDLRDAALGLVGVTFGVSYLTVLIAGLTVGLMEHWQRAGVRIAGSWIVAASIMVLTLSIAAPVKRGTTTPGHLLGLTLPC